MRLRLSPAKGEGWWPVSAALLVTLALGLAACSGPSQKREAAVPTSGEQVKVELGEWFMGVDRTSVPVGKVIVEGFNKGKEPHEIVVMRTDMPEDGLVVDVRTKEVDVGASGLILGEIEPEDLGQGKETSATFTLPAGSYVLFCNVAEHYQKGMHVAFTVKD